MSIIDVKNLSIEFQLKKGPASVIKDLSYSIYESEILGIVGESGCGKSVTSLALMRLLPPNGKITQGQILFDHQDLTQISETAMEKIRGYKMAMIFQEPMTALNPVLTIGEQISEQILIHESVSRKEALDRTIDMLKLVGIPSPELRVKQFPHELSGGMRQRAMIAMALSTKPKFLIADEPTTALDVTIQAQILELIQELQEKFKMSVQFITHDLGVISELSDRVLIMYGGILCELAPSQEIFQNPKHPYTQALIEARPKLGHRVEKLRTIEGSVPGLLERPSGCPFFNRCFKAQSQCQETLPLETHISSQHIVRCFYPEN